MLWPVLDVDGERKDTVSAIGRAQGLLRLFEEMGLAEHTVWMLSGTGFRVAFPFLIPIVLRSGFKAFMRDLGDYGVDSGPYDSPDPPPIRMLCYRGHPSQRQRKDAALDRHTVVVGPEVLLYSILIGVDTPELDNLVLFGQRNSWTDLIEELERRRPGVGRLSVSLPNWGNRNWTYALGTVLAAGEWENGLAACLRELGYNSNDFNQSSWREG
jgi:hypothetical protein